MGRDDRQYGGFNIKRSGTGHSSAGTVRAMKCLNDKCAMEFVGHTDQMKEDKRCADCGSRMASIKRTERGG